LYFLHKIKRIPTFSRNPPCISLFYCKGKVFFSIGQINLKLKNACALAFL
jgi:hypothetical protein